MRRLRHALERLDAVGARGWALALGGAALLVRLPFMVGHWDARAGKDDVVFIGASDRLLHHFEFDDDFYTPGYPAFEALLRLVPGHAESTITVAQHLLGVAMVVAIVLVAWRWFGRGPALLAGALSAFTPIQVVHEHTLLPDFLFAVLVFAGAVALAASLRRDRDDLRLLAAAGVLFGLATWVKPAGTFLFMAAPLAALIVRGGLRPALRPAGVVTLALALTIAPWVLRNTIERDHFGMSRQGGQTLFKRVFQVDGLPIPSDHRYAPFAEEVRARSAAAPQGGNFYNDFKQALIDERGLSWADAIEVEREMSQTAARRHPLRYAEDTWGHLRDDVGHMDDFDRSWELLDDLDRRPEPVEAAVRETWSASRKLVDVWWLLSLNAAAGLLLLFIGPAPRRAAATALFAVWLSVMLGTALAHGGLWRYSVQMAPITWILGSAGLVLVARAVWEHVRVRQ